MVFLGIRANKNQFRKALEVKYTGKYHHLEEVPGSKPILCLGAEGKMGG
jgi:hypothetical protein